MSWPALLIEAFASGPCGGNGAAVVLLPQPLPDADLQAIAASLKQSETAFLLRQGDQWLLRWFTPSCEVRLCGHATLAALLALGHWGWLQPGQSAIFHSRSGPLPVQLAARPPAIAAANSDDNPNSGAGANSGDKANSAATLGPGASPAPDADVDPGSGSTGSIQLPAGELVPSTLSSSLRQELERRCGAALVSSWSSSLGYWVALLSDGLSLAPLDGLAAILSGPERAGLVVMAATNSAATAAGLLFPAPPAAATPAAHPDAASSAAAGQVNVNGLKPDYQLRFFAPGLGIDEDPVTGSAHALVAPYWLERTGRRQVVGWQPSPRPGGMVVSAASSGMIQLLGSGHLLWDGRLRFKSCENSCGDGGLGEWAALANG
jgi:predicted PhzF superfamily epimerase YddE/YHI9